MYFSPRNMRRQKELASQMGIDVAWNCAISLRPLESGQEDDPHRMTSNYADWDVNAKLPHGLENVRTHLREVDNVPLLVSLFTDVTKETTNGMVSYKALGHYVDRIALHLHACCRLRRSRSIMTPSLPLVCLICKGIREFLLLQTYPLPSISSLTSLHIQPFQRTF